MRLAAVVATVSNSVTAHDHTWLFYRAGAKHDHEARAAAKLRTSVLVVVEAAKGGQHAAALVPAPLHLASRRCTLLFKPFGLCTQLGGSLGLHPAQLLEQLGTLRALACLPLLQGSKE